ncbi:hypothetical protein GC177_02960 [bacterium]|nr:hypothetical protein [bacterium]
MRYDALKKRVSKIGLVCGGIIGGCGVLAFAAYSFYADRADKLHKLETSIRTTNSDIQNLDDGLNKSRTSLPIYNTLMAKNPPNTETLDRKKLTEVIAYLKEHYDLVDAQISISPIVKLDKDPFTLQRMKAEHALVTVTVGALSDELLFSFIDHLMRVAPGLTVAESLNVERMSNMDDAFYDAISSGKPVQAVKGTFSFHWIGVSKADVPADAAGAPPTGATP